MDDAIIVVFVGRFECGGSCACKICVDAEYYGDEVVVIDAYDLDDFKLQINDYLQEHGSACSMPRATSPNTPNSRLYEEICDYLSTVNTEDHNPFVPAMISYNNALDQLKLRYFFLPGEFYNWEP